MSSTSSAPSGAVALDVRDVAVELGLELAAVQQAGERVVVGHELQLRLEALAVGDVLELAKQAFRCPIGVRRSVPCTEMSIGDPTAGMIRSSIASCSIAPAASARSASLTLSASAG